MPIASNSAAMAQVGSYSCSLGGVGGAFGRSRTGERSWRLGDGTMWSGEIYKFANAATADKMRSSRSLPMIDIDSTIGALPKLEPSQSTVESPTASPKRSSVKVKHKRGGHLQMTRSLSLDHVKRSVYRDAALMQPVVKGNVDMCSMPSNSKDLENALIDCSNKKQRNTPCGDRLVPQLRRSRRWQALLDAKNEGNLIKLRTVLKEASLDVELSSMPVVHETREILQQAVKWSHKAEEAMREVKNLNHQLTKLQIAVRGAEQVPLGPKLWEDPWLAKAKEKLSLHDIITVEKSNQMVKDACASGEIYDLEEAILASRSVDVEEEALEDANVLLAEKRAAAGEEIRQSVYFTDRANAGFKDGILFRRLCFHGEKRIVHALIFNVKIKDWTNIARAHAFFGIRVYFHQVGFEQRMPELETILKDPSRTTLWIVSSNGKVRDKYPTPMKQEHVEKILQFYYNGGGLAMWCAHSPWVHEANMILKELEINPIQGKFVGNEMITKAPETEPSRSGFNGEHLVNHGIRKVFCGAEDSSRIPESILKRGWTEVLRSRQNTFKVIQMSPCQTKEVTTVTKLANDRGAMLCALLEPVDRFGPLLLHARYSMLFELDQPGVMFFLQQVAAYMALRPSDLTGLVRNEIARAKGTYEHRRLTYVREQLEAGARASRIGVLEQEVEEEEEGESNTTTVRK